MPDLVEKHIGCPYCGEAIDILVDDSLPQQRYVEDCQVCCRPIVFDVIVAGELDVQVSVSREND